MTTRGVGWIGGRSTRTTKVRNADSSARPIASGASSRRKVQPRDLAGLPFVLFEVGSATRKVIDRFFASQHVEPTIVMDTENVEIIKAMVKTGLGVGIVPYQAVAREVKAGQLFCARIEGHELVRETGWVYARANRVPRIVDELLLAFGAIRDKLRLAPRGRADGVNG